MALTDEKEGNLRNTWEKELPNRASSDLSFSAQASRFRMGILTDGSKAKYTQEPISRFVCPG